VGTAHHSCHLFLDASPAKAESGAPPDFHRKIATQIRTDGPKNSPGRPSGIARACEYNARPLVRGVWTSELEVTSSSPVSGGE